MSDYKFTASEFAKMLGITTSAVRKQRLKGKLEGQYIKKGSEYFYASPPKSRPNKVEVTPYSNPKFHGSVYRPKNTLVIILEKGIEIFHMMKQSITTRLMDQRSS